MVKSLPQREGYDYGDLAKEKQEERVTYSPEGGCR